MAENTNIRTFVSTKVALGDSKNKRVTSVALIAIHNFEFSNSQGFPRILDKLVLSFDEVTKTGHEGMGRLFSSFLDRQEPPICLLSHHGSETDFPALKAKSMEMGDSLDEIGGYFLQCIDTKLLFESLPVFRSVQGPGEEHSSMEYLFRLLLGEEYKGTTLEDECSGLIRLLLSVKGKKEFFSKNFQKFRSISPAVLAPPSSCDTQSHCGSDGSDEKIASYVFWDLETTGWNKATDAITEICMIATRREEIMPIVPDHAIAKDLMDILPRIYDKIRLAVDPQMRISYMVAETTGLTNQLLEDSKKPTWDDKTTLLIRDFIAKQAQPCCLMAYNGNSFDVKFLDRYIRKYGNYEAQFSEFFRGDPMVGVRQLTKHLNQQKGTSYSFDAVYQRLTGKTDIPDRHSSEGDTKGLIIIVRLCPGDVLEWIDQKKAPLMQQAPVRKSKKQSHTSSDN